MRNPTLMLTHPEASREPLLDMVRKIPGARMGIKIAALLLILEGQRPGWVADVLGLTRQSLNIWMHRVNDEGLKGLVPVKRPGRPPRLSSKVQQQLEEDLEKPPSAFGLPRVRWDGPTLVVHLKRRFGITLRVRQAQSWMHRLGYRLKRAGYTHLQGKSKEAKRFRQVLKKTPGTEPEGDGVFEDETGFTLHPRLGMGWAKRGKRFRVPTTSQHRERLNVFGWVAPLLGRQGMIRWPRGDREGFIACLRNLYRRLRAYTIWLYVDRARWHKGEEIDLFVRTHKRLHLEYLPSYQPRLNPQERIWRQLRYEATTNC